MKIFRLIYEKQLKFRKHNLTFKFQSKTSHKKKLTRYTLDVLINNFLLRNESESL